MNLIRPSFEILSHIETHYADHIERIARTCYKSESKITNDSAAPFVSGLVNCGHLAMVEFQDMTVRFTCDRAIANELVRHRMCSFAQESTRYVNYKGGIGFVAPLFEKQCDFTAWAWFCQDAEQMYMQMLEDGSTPQIARSVLPLCTKTELVMKANLREWRHILELRTDKAAHPQIRELMIPLAKYCNSAAPEIFQISGDPQFVDVDAVRDQHDKWWKEMQ